jgi:hypothetical protein
MELCGGWAMPPTRFRSLDRQPFLAALSRREPVLMGKDGQGVIPLTVLLAIEFRPPEAVVPDRG